jgi:DNA-binding transcriptional MerR regulator/methylmalonyl-CoA mutase cobalamin-binding subunit
MRTIARMTDFSPALLRAWERRHNLLHPLRGPGGHRMYTEEDLQVLLRVRELSRQGRSIGEIAGLGRDVLLRQGAERFQSAAEEEQPKPEKLGTEALQVLSGHCDQIVDAALKLDSRLIGRTLDQCFSRVSPEAVIFEVIEPATRKIGEHWAAGKCSVASEHMASGVFVQRLLRLVDSAEPVRSDRRPVIVACFPDEYHQLGALVVSYQLCRHGLRVIYLGAALPFGDLESACSVLQPSAVLLSATRPALFQVHRRGLLEATRRFGRDVMFFLGGQGAPAADPQLAQFGVHPAPKAKDSRESLSLLADQIRKSAQRVE